MAARATAIADAAAIVVAGGASSRMGIDKAWLELDGRPLLAHVAGTLAQAVATVIVVGTPGQPLPALPPGCLRVDDAPEHAGQGPLRAVQTGLRALAELGVARAFLASTDAPALTAAHVRTLVGGLDVTREAMRVPIDEQGRPHPLLAAVHVSAALGAARWLLERGERRMLALVDALAAQRVPASALPDRRVLLPCNTPIEWERLHAAITGRDAPKA
jgi:molybdopterin-guanine dinucleotide biosynthesis protein A